MTTITRATIRRRFAPHAVVSLIIAAGLALCVVLPLLPVVVDSSPPDAASAEAARVSLAMAGSFILPLFVGGATLAILVVAAVLISTSRRWHRF